MRRTRSRTALYRSSLVFLSNQRRRLQSQELARQQRTRAVALRLPARGSVDSCAENTGNGAQRAITSVSTLYKSLPRLGKGTPRRSFRGGGFQFHAGR